MSARASISALVRMALCIAATATAVAVAAASAPPRGAPGAVSQGSRRTLAAVAWPRRAPTGISPLADTSASRPLERALRAQVSAALPATGCIEWSTLAEGLPLTNIGTNALYDPVRERMVVFGGSGQTEVRAQSLTGPPHWTRLPAQGVPPPHGYDDRAIYDPVRDRMLLFRSGTNEVWELPVSGTPAWRLLSTTNAPYVGGRFALAYDPVRDRAIVFGGSTTEGDPLIATWALSLGGLAWSALPDGPDVYDPRAFYDPARDRLVIVSGHNPVTAYALSLSGTPQWSGLACTGTPPGLRDGVAATYDPVRDRMLVFGGLMSGYLNDLWELRFQGGTAAVWASLAAGNPPAGRDYANAVYDTPRDRMVLFGGRNHQDTWVLPLTGPLAWSELDDPNRPPTPRGAHSAIWDAPRQRMVVFGGEGWDNPAMSDVRGLSLSGSPGWSSLAPAGPGPVGRADHSAIYDPVRERMVVFGGREGSNARLLADVWALSLAGTPAWTPLAPGVVAPGKRSSHTAIYDPVRDRMIVFGGYDDALVYHNDTWAYDLGGGGWQRLDPSGTPPTPTVEHCAVYDPLRDRMLVIGGFDRVTGFLNTVWALSLAGGGSWTQLSPAGSPPPTRDGAAVYDPSRDRVLLYGGTSYSSDVYALDLSGGLRWSVAATNAPPPPRDGHAAIFDADHDRMIVVCGVFNSWTGFGEYRNDVIALTVLANAAPLTVAVDPAGAGAVLADPLESCYVTGANVTLTATPAMGYGFSGWGGDAAGSENPLTIAMTGPRNVVARFEPVSTATLIAQFVATTSERGVELRWRFGTPERVTAVAIERAPAEVGPWVGLSMETVEDGGAALALDPTAEPGREYFYRLTATLSDGSRATFGPVSSRAADPIRESAITFVAPNPSAGAARIQFTVARAGRVNLVVADVAGRRVATLVDGYQTAGPYSVAWDGATPGGRVPPGLYFLRLATTDRTVVRRLAILR